MIEYQITSFKMAQTQKPGNAKLLIGELAKLAGVKPDTIRFYERSWLLPNPQRLASGYRAYDDTTAKRLRFIKQAQLVGFSLDEIQRVLRLSEQGEPPCRSVIAIAEATLSETEAKLQELERFAQKLKSTLSRWRGQCPRGREMAAEFCTLIESGETVPSR